ncbi:MAG: enoyl-CoA hydratase [Kangiellaceae bacterium]|jgi:enoyl-CoA hydratase/carnithine racemase|nr:enoyl-CoA hydratase [Kangiellaceae bacterium]
MTTHIETTRQGEKLVLKFNRPDKKNAITAAMYQALADGVTKASDDESIRVINIIGDDRSFCAGNDLQDFLENPPESLDSPVWQFLFALADCKKTIIAGVNGPAVGIGTTLLLHCDFVVASESAVFALPFVPLGLCPEAASSLLIPMQAGYKKANEWLLLGDRFSANDALNAGMINKVVADSAQVAEQVDTWSNKIVKMPAESIDQTRRLIREPYYHAVKQQLAEEGEVFQRLLKSDAAKQAFEAFLNR